MKTILVSGTALALCAGTAFAGGIERTTQSAMVLFETGNHAEISFGFVKPSVDGKSRPPVSSNIDNVAGDYVLPSFALKMDLSDRLAAALIVDRPFGADVSYGMGDAMLGGTTAEASTTAITALMKYSFTPNFSAFGGVRHMTAEGAIHLQGAAYGPVSGYDVELDRQGAFGYVAGVAYEKPEIALRVALTYNSSIEYDFDTTETGPLVDPDGPGPLPSLPLLAGTSETTTKLPESWNLEFQSGIAKDTLLFGSIRHVKHSQFRVDPVQLDLVTGSGLIDLEDTTTYRLGLGRKFNDKFSGSVTVAYEPGTGELVSPLAPTDGFTSLSVGGAYKFNDAVTLSGGVSYTWLGNAKPETGTPDVARADFKDNTVLGVGFKIAYKF
ncbi:OmpP1/FadL family transporter [Puniceibacterium sp. IMCC21224]|uniref:OmpP1/FadL family transporter n=1 Tax=Puniceibacterium sp. IMCC21224 TaxID=1618204 RepID=UPI00064DC8CC|nr:outer membrane protein transport protein [Puniceibacterium sp. IMCC21224]KMK66886.1 long-chain fatty acid transport protein [Puniceibacterium sp. IMCC21224]